MDEAEVKIIRRAVEPHFRVYDVRWDESGVMLYLSLTHSSLESFPSLQEELKKQGYISGLRRIGGEDVLVVGTAPVTVPSNVRTNIILLFFTVLTTVWAGSVLWASSYGSGSSIEDTFALGNLAMGALTFALPLMFILGVHEMGHYMMAKRYGMNPTLPYFIPAPPPILFGTFGAFISIKDPMPNRKALFDIGIAGPISGFVAAIPVVLIGLSLTTGSEDIDESGDYTLLNLPMLYLLLQQVVPPSGSILHPTAFAGWVGLLVTAMNLLPIGQLDGGHIAKAFLQDRAHYASYAVLGVLIVLGFAYPGWIFFALLVIFLGMRHPPPLDDITDLDGKRKAMGFVIVAVMVLSFVPIPFETVHYEAPEHELSVSVPQSEGAAMPNGSWTFPVTVRNVGNRDEEMSFTAIWNSSGTNMTTGPSLTLDRVEMALGTDDVGSLNLTATALSDASIGTAYDIILVIDVLAEEAQDINLSLVLWTGDVAIALGGYDGEAAIGRLHEIPFEVIDLAGNGNFSLTVNSTNCTFYIVSDPATEILVEEGMWGECTVAPFPAGNARLMVRWNAEGEMVPRLTVASQTNEFTFSIEAHITVTKG